MNLNDFTQQVMNTPRAKELKTKYELIDLADAIHRLKHKAFLVSNDDKFDYIVFGKGERDEFLADYHRLMKYLVDER